MDPFDGEISHSLVSILSASTTSQNQDPYGKLLSGELRLRCALFKVPSVREMVVERKNYEDKADYDNWALSIDSCEEDFLDLETYFLPLAESPYFSTLREDLVIGGILVQQDSNCGQERAFQRVGFAVVSNNGNIADLWHCEQWAAPPWPDNIAQEVIII
jgi:hypothetical protein